MAGQAIAVDTPLTVKTDGTRQGHDPIVDRWYNKGHDHYHHDEGEGIDMYNIGSSRGNGGTGIWDGRQLYVGANYSAWKVIANGPLRAIFELTCDAWDAAGIEVS